MAREHRCYITYAAVREMADGSWRNSLQMLDRNGDIAGIYDKNFPRYYRDDRCRNPVRGRCSAHRVRFRPSWSRDLL